MEQLAIIAVRSGDLETLTNLLNSGLPVTVVDEDGNDVILSNQLINVVSFLSPLTRHGLKTHISATN